jgi:hypothetical protein
LKALVKESAGPGFVLRDVPEPTIRDDEVLIRVRRAGVCGTDVHIYEWDDWARGRCKPPFTVGHEFAGEVAQVGKLVTDVKEGDRVTAEGHIVDGRCLLCRTGNAHVCPHTKIIGVDRDGCFAEYIAMPAVNVWHLDDNVSFDIGGIHDPMGNAFHTALTADIPGATGQTYSILAVSSSDAASYQVVATNEAGSAVSSDEVLVVDTSTTNIAPVIVTQPTGVLTVAAGGTATFTVVATGTLSIGTFGTVNLNGGTLSAGTLSRGIAGTNGVLNFNSGTLTITAPGGLTLGSSGPLGRELVPAIRAFLDANPL